MKKVLLTLFLPLLAFIVVFSNSGIANADPFARGRWYGYFHNRLETTGDDLFRGGIYVGNAQQFLEFYWARLWDGNPQNHKSAAFTVLTMLGAPAGTYWEEAKTRWGEFDRTIRWYEANGRVNWAAMYPYTFNTYYQRGAQDVAWYIEPDTRDSIVFYNPNGTTYAIKKDCANPVGDMSALFIPPPPPPPPPPTNIACGSMTVSPSRLEVGQSASVRVTANFSGGPPTPSTGAIIRVIGPGFDREWTGVAPNPPVPSGPGGGSLSFNSGTFTVANPGLYTVAWIVGVNETNTGICGGSYNLNYDSFEVSNFPFLQIRGGDVAAGATFATAQNGSCNTAANANAGIVSWNNNSPSYSGAGTQYGAFARNYIQDFITNKGNNPSPTSLAFSNRDAGGASPDSVNTGAGRYGGYFGWGPCAKYWSDVPSTSPAGAITNGSLNGRNGVYRFNGNLSIDASTLAAGTHLTIYVEGNVNIRGNITYAGGSYANISQIPSFKLVVKGVIHIESTVSVLDGVYAAIPDVTTTGPVNSYAAPRAGTISTCSTGFTVRNPSAAPVSAMINACNRQLTVNGGLSGKQIFFLRTNGTMSAGTPAELINYSPELWLAPSAESDLDPAYQSIIGLPPVL